MSESLEKSRQATSGWRRTSIAAISALFAFILARFAVRARPALPSGTRQVETADETLDRQIRLRLHVTMATAPEDFTARVLARVGTLPTPQPQRAPEPASATRGWWLRSWRILAGTVSLALVLMLMTGVVITLVNPTLAVTILDALMSLAIGLLAVGRMVGHLVARAAETPWIIPVSMGVVLGFLLLSWVQLARQFGRDPQEA